tara:strand:+ start:630 stop:1157 length:528 start_codon:yes stop_codon:yes gene_type:complete
MAMKKKALQNLSIGSWFSGAAHTVEHGVEHGADEVAHDLSAAAKAVGPYAKWAADETWKGATWCATNTQCTAAVKKYGAKAVELAMKKKALQNLSFGSFVHHAEHSVSTEAHKVGHALSNASHHVAPDLKWAAGKTWKGIKWCDADAVCKASVEKVGETAVIAAMGLQQQIIILV